MRTAALAMGILAASASSSAHAAQPTLSLRAGSYYGITSAGIGLSWPVAVVERDGWRATGEVELQFNRHRTQDAPVDDSLEQAGAFINLRAAHGDRPIRPYLEIGLGGNAFSQVHLGNKTFSTAFQFGEHIGIGVLARDRWLLGVRYAHYSNADIKRPNNGLDLYQVVVGYTF